MSLEAWQAVVTNYGNAFAFAAHLWVPGLWALVGALAAPALATPWSVHRVEADTYSTHICATAQGRRIR